MLNIRKAADRGHANHGWLDAHHTFSFAEYHDPAYMGFSVLRVINEDRITPGAGFPTHGHQDMEIITYILEGALEHKDSLGNTAVIKPGEVQYMAAGTGVRHSEFNHFHDQQTHLLQIWIYPDKEGYPPSYGQKSFDAAFNKSEWVLVVSNDGREGSIPIHQNVNMVVLKSKNAGDKKYKMGPKRNAWIQMIRGQMSINGTPLEPSDGAGISSVDELNLHWEANSEFILFDLP